MQIAFGVAGAAIGGFFGGPAGASLGWTLGSIAGGLLFPPQAKGSSTVGPRQTDLIVQNSSWGLPQSWAWGEVAVSGNIIWAVPIKEVSTTTSQGGGGKGQGAPAASSTTFSYFGNWATAICKGPIKAYGRIWADGKLIRNADGSGDYNQYFTFYYGSETQLADPTIESHKGAGLVAAYRGTAYIVATDLPLTNFGNRVPNLKVEIVTTDGATLTYDGKFIAKSNYPSTLTPAIWLLRNYGGTTDRYGNFVVTYGTAGSNAFAFDKTGALVWHLTGSGMADMIDAFAGAAVVDRALGINEGIIAPILGGAYLLMTFAANGVVAHFDQWMAILAPVTSGTPAILGIARYSKPATGVPYTMPRAVSVSNAQTADDPLLLQGYGGLGASDLTLAVLPSVNAIINGFGPAASIGAVSYRAYECAYAVFNPFVSGDFANYLLIETTANGNVNLMGGWALPKIDLSNPALPIVTTNYYFYFNRGYMDWNAGHSGANVDLEVKNVLQPTYPHGCVIKLDLSEVGHPGRPGTSGTVTFTTVTSYAVDNPNWVDAANAAILPFADEYTYLSTGASGGGDTYQMQPYVEKLSDGSGAYLVGFVMAGIDDNKINNLGAREYERVRALKYNPETEKFTQFSEVSGPIYSNTEIGYGGALSSSVFYDDNLQTLYRVGDTLYLWGAIGGAGASAVNGTVYFTRFGNVDLNGTVTLDVIVGDILAACGMVNGTDFDVTGLASQIVQGFFIGRESTAKSALATLQQIYLFDGIESDWQLKFKFRGGTPLATIAEDDLGARSGQNAVTKVTETRTEDVDLPRSVTLRYLAQALDYQQAAQHAQRPVTTMHSTDRQQLDGSLVLSGQDAMQQALKVLYLQWTMRTAFQIALPPPYIIYDPGDVLTLEYLNADGSAEVSVPIYLTGADFGADFVLPMTALNTDGEVYLPAPTPAVSYTPSSSAVSLIEPTTLVLLDLPPLRDQDDNFGYYAAAAGKTTAWKGALVYRSADGVTYDPLFPIAAASPMGVATTALAAPDDVALHDTVNTVTVQMSYGALASATREETLRYTNLAALESGSGWEIFTFDTATLVGSSGGQGIYQLALLMRGMKGTEQYVSDHAAGDRFVLLNPSNLVRQIDAAINRDVSLHFKPVSNGLTLSSAVAQSFTDTGASLKPYSPAALAGTRDGSNNLTLTWLRRGRIYAEWSDGGDVPLPADETPEAYEVDVIVASVVVRTITKTASGGGSVVTASSQSALYTAADQTTDGLTPGDPVTVKVYQLSALIGRGYPAENTV